MKNRQVPRVVPAMVNVRGLPYVIPHSMSRTSEESGEQTPRLPEGLLLLRIAAAVPPLPAHLRLVPLALFALMVPSYLLRGYFAPASGNPVSGATSRSASSTAGCTTLFGSAMLPYKGCWSKTSMLIVKRKGVK